MSDTGTPQTDQILDLSVDVALRLALLAFLLVMCVIIVRPFAILILWAIILAVALAGPFEKLVGVVGKRGRAATIMSLTAIALIAIPSWFTGTSLIESVRDIQEICFTPSSSAGAMIEANRSRAVSNRPACKSTSARNVRRR